MFLTRDQILKALGEGVLLLIKYGLLIILVLFSLYQYNSLSQKAESGNQAAIAINDYIKNGYLPNFPLQPKKTEK